MKFYNTVICSMLVLLAGCQSTPKQTLNDKPHQVNQAIITEPLAVDFKSELAIAKLSQIITHMKLEDEKLAQLYYDRGVIYDSLGLRSLAQLDFRSALELKPDHADAYNFIGIHLTLLGQYEAAFDAFDSALEINPKHNFAYLNRAIALYYFGRPELSLPDIETFFIDNMADPYRAVWLYLIESQIEPQEATLRLAFNATQMDSDNWAYRIVELFLNRISEQQFLASMKENVANPRMLADRLCEGYFYLAKYKMNQNQPEAAKNYFRLSLTTNVYEFVEHKYARIELQRIYQQERAAYEEMTDTIEVR